MSSSPSRLFFFSSSLTFSFLKAMRWQILIWIRIPKAVREEHNCIPISISNPFYQMMGEICQVLDLIACRRDWFFYSHMDNRNMLKWKCRNYCSRPMHRLLESLEVFLFRFPANLWHMISSVLVVKGFPQSHFCVLISIIGW